MIVLDTNALMMPVECHVRLFEELDRLLPDATDYVAPAAVRDELAKLADGAGAEATAASSGGPARPVCDSGDDSGLRGRRRRRTRTDDDSTTRSRTTTPSRRLLDAGVRVISIRGTEQS